jgi:hypothetical protein
MKITDAQARVLEKLASGGKLHRHRVGGLKGNV